MRLLALLILSMWSNAAIATSPGVFTFLGKNQCAPFEGTLFNPVATANILSETQFAQAKCQSIIDFELGTQKADYDLQLTNLQIRHDALISQYDTTVQSLTRENEALSTALKKQSKKDPWKWFIVGALGGVAMSYTVYEVVNE
mgnify:CR=1 FL=1